MFSTVIGAVGGGAVCYFPFLCAFSFAVAVIPAGLPFCSSILQICLWLNLAGVVHLPAQGTPRVAHARSSYHQQSCSTVSVSDNMQPPPSIPSPIFNPSPLSPAVCTLCTSLASRPKLTGLWDDADCNYKSTSPPSHRSTFDKGGASTTRDLLRRRTSMAAAHPWHRVFPLAPHTWDAPGVLWRPVWLIPAQRVVWHVRGRSPEGPVRRSCGSASFSYLKTLSAIFVVMKLYSLAVMDGILNHQ